MRRALLCITVSAMVIGFAGCLFYSSEFSKYKKYTWFLKKPKVERIAEFRRYPLDEQFNIYVCAMVIVHPPDLIYAGEIAMKGEEVVPFLMRKLKEAEKFHSKSDREIMQQSIIYIFETMAMQKKHNLPGNRYDLKQNKELIAYLKTIVATMEPKTLELELSKKSLDIILSEKKDNG